MLRQSIIGPVQGRNHLIAFAIALAALAFTIACGGGKQESGGETAVVPPSTATTPGTGDSSGTVSGTPSPVTASYAEAEDAYREKRYGDAMEMFGNYVERQPDNPWGHYMLGLSAWKSGDLERARSAFERSLELDGKNVKTLLNLSRVLLDQGDPRTARGHVLAALALDSTSSDVYRLLGRVRGALRQNDEAMDAYRRALVLDPTDSWSMNNLALLLIQQDRFEEALGPLARAVQLDPSVPVFQNNLGIALERTGHNELAASAYQAALQADSTYEKASVSLMRLANRKDDPGAIPVELSVLADAFDRSIRDGTVQPVVAKKPPVPPLR